MTSPITIVGNLTADPELRFTPSGAAVTNFKVAVNERKKNAATDSWEDDGATFYNCSVWREHAENVAESLQKGDRVIVQGGLRTRTFERREGGEGLSLDVSVDSVGPELRFATTKVTRTPRQGGGQFQGGGQQSYQGGGQQAPQGGGQSQGGDPWGSPAPQGGGQQADPWATSNGEPPF